MELTEETARRFARIALGHVAKEYPHKLDHVMASDADVQPPRILHPCFFGSFDWHSCVHGWWTLLTIRRLFPGCPEAAQIAELANDTFTQAKLAVELEYLATPESAGFERPYGWGWLLYLHLEASRHEDQSWGAMLAPLAKAFGQRFHSYLGKLTYPIRTGTHFNTAFALTLAQPWAERFDPELDRLIAAKAKDWFAQDQGCQAWEPGGDEFLSPAISEALLMQRVMPAGDFADWFAAFLPDLSAKKPATLFTPATVSDRSDGKIAHLDGLNLSRAWGWREIARSIPDYQTLANEAAELHLTCAMEHIDGDYAGEHWLASFALLALLASAD